MSRTVIKGVLKTWKEDRGFGFIKPDDGGKDIFIHISALKGVSRRPITGDIIYYQSTKDSRGKFKAINASIEGVSIAKETNSDNALALAMDSKKIWLIGLGLAVILIVAVVIGLNAAAQ
jgi:cold shock protein